MSQKGNEMTWQFVLEMAQNDGLRMFGILIVPTFGLAFHLIGQVTRITCSYLSCERFGIGRILFGG